MLSCHLVVSECTLSVSLRERDTGLFVLKEQPTHTHLTPAPMEFYLSCPLNHEWSLMSSAADRTKDRVAKQKSWYADVRATSLTPGGVMKNQLQGREDCKAVIHPVVPVHLEWILLMDTQTWDYICK